MSDDWMQIISGFLFAAGGAILTFFHGRMSKMEDKHTALELHVANEKISKSDLKETMDRIERTLEGIWKELKGKADK